MHIRSSFFITPLVLGRVTAHTHLQPCARVFRISATIKLESRQWAVSHRLKGYGLEGLRVDDAPVESEHFAENEDQHHADEDARLLHVRSHALGGVTVVSLVYSSMCCKPTRVACAFPFHFPPLPIALLPSPLPPKSKSKSKSNPHKSKQNGLYSHYPRQPQSHTRPPNPSTRHSTHTPNA